MASLGLNSIWNDIESGATTVETDLTGPVYSYVDNIPGPSSMGVGSNGSMSQIATNTGAIIDYVKYMVSGPALGNRYFVNTGGSCKAPDGSVQSRYNYINNVADTANILPASMRAELGGIASDFNGLLPGILGDVEGLSPTGLLSSLMADSTPDCKCYTCEVSTGSESRFLNLGLTNDFDPTLCTEQDVSVCATSTEGFTDGSTDLNPLLIALGIFILLQVF